MAEKTLGDWVSEIRLAQMGVGLIGDIGGDIQKRSLSQHGARELLLAMEDAAHTMPLDAFQENAARFEDVYIAAMPLSLEYQPWHLLQRLAMIDHRRAIEFFIDTADQDDQYDIKLKAVLDAAICHDHRILFDMIFHKGLVARGYPTQDYDPALTAAQFGKEAVFDYLIENGSNIYTHKNAPHAMHLGIQTLFRIDSPQSEEAVINSGQYKIALKLARNGVDPSKALDTLHVFTAYGYPHLGQTLMQSFAAHEAGEIARCTAQITQPPERRGKRL